MTITSILQHITLLSFFGSLYPTPRDNILIKKLFFFCSRHVLASLHFNENLKRETRQAEDGSNYVKVTYPKYKLGEEVVREVAVPPTYGRDTFVVLNHGFYSLSYYHQRHVSIFKYLLCTGMILSL